METKGTVVFTDKNVEDKECLDMICAFIKSSVLNENAAAISLLRLIKSSDVIIVEGAAGYGS